MVKTDRKQCATPPGFLAKKALGNVPLNNDLEALSLEKMNTNELKKFRTYYEINWNNKETR